MRIIISPAKKMNEDWDCFLPTALPQFLNKTEILLDTLRQMEPASLQVLWKCSDKIAEENIRRLRDMDLKKRLTPAIFSYEGIQYQYMAPRVFTNKELGYVQEHLRILSGFYGILKPMDGVTPYRLEMQAKLKTGQGSDLYQFWGGAPAQALAKETDCIINLASKEYSVCIAKYIPSRVRFVTCVFGEEKGGKVVEKGTLCKMARGEMVRYMAQNNISDPEDLKSFTGLNYRFSSRHSKENTLVFLLQESP